MKIKTILFVLLIGATLASSAMAQSGNLLLNAGFETRMASGGWGGYMVYDGPWLAYYPTTSSSVYHETYKTAFAGGECGPVDVFEGDDAAWVATTPGVPAGRASIWQSVSVTPNTYYSASAWVHTYKPQALSLGFGNDPTDFAALKITMDGADIVLGQVTTLTSWTQLSGTFLTGPATTSVWFWLDTQMNEGAFEGGVTWDSTSLSMVPEPSCLAALGGALLGLPLVFRRKK